MTNVRNKKIACDLFPLLIIQKPKSKNVKLQEKIGKYNIQGKINDYYALFCYDII